MSMKTLFLPDTGESFELDPGIRLCWTVGRSPNCEVCLDHAFISAKHFRIQYAPPETHQEEGHWDIRDLRSTNGTYLDGRRLPPDNWEPLQLQSKIQVGRHLLVFMEKEDTLQSESEEAEPELPPAQQLAQPSAPRTFADVFYAIATWAVSAPSLWETIGRLFILTLLGFGAFILISQVV